MTLVFFSGRDPRSSIGGHQTYVRAHALAAVAAGYSPHIFCVGRPSEEAASAYGVVHRVASPLATVRHPAMLLHAPALTRAVLRCLASHPGPHLLHGFGPWAYTASAAAQRLRRRGAGATVVASAYSTLEHDWRGKLTGLGPAHGSGRRARYLAEYLWVRAVAGRCEMQGYRAARLVLVNYESVRRLLTVSCPGLGEVRRLPYAATAAFQDQAAEGSAMPEGLQSLQPADAPLIVCVARHDPRKGLDRLLGCLARLQHGGVSFRACLVGPGTLLEAHRRLAGRLRLDRSTAIPGRVPEPQAYLRQAEIFVLPTLEEGSGSVALLEALQAGCAVIASACDGIPEDLVDGESALLVPPGDDAALQAAIARLLADSALRQRLRRGGRAVFEARFSSQALIRALAATYTELGFAA